MTDNEVALYYALSRNAMLLWTSPKYYLQTLGGPSWCVHLHSTYLAYISTMYIEDLYDK